MPRDAYDRRQPYSDERYGRPLNQDRTPNADIDPRSLMQVEAEIRRLSQEMNHHTTALIAQSQEWAEAKHTHEQARAAMYLRVKDELADEKPTIPEIEAHVEIETGYTHQRLLIAEARMKASRQVCQALIAQLDALRSINANARAAADFTRGEGA